MMAEFQVEDAVEGGPVKPTFLQRVGLGRKPIVKVTSDAPVASATSGEGPQARSSQAACTTYAVFSKMGGSYDMEGTNSLTQLRTGSGAGCWTAARKLRES